VVEALWTAIDVANYFRASRSWVYEKASSGAIPSIQLGGLLRFDPQTIQALARGETFAGGKVISLPIPPRKKNRKEGLDT
jgi:excisionase family DNA binding protein